MIKLYIQVSRRKIKLTLIAITFFCMSIQSQDFSATGVYSYGEIFHHLQKFYPISVIGSGEILGYERSFLLLAKNKIEFEQQIKANLKSDGYTFAVKAGVYSIFPIENKFNDDEQYKLDTLPKSMYTLPSGKPIFTDSISILPLWYSDSVKTTESSDSARFINYSCRVIGKRYSRLKSGGMFLSPELLTIHPTGDASSLLGDLLKGAQSTVNVSPITLGVVADFDSLEFFHSADFSGNWGDLTSIRVGEEKRRLQASMSDGQVISEEFETYYTGLNVGVENGNVSVEYRLQDMVFNASGQLGAVITVVGTIETKGRGLFNRHKTTDYLEISVIVQERFNSHENGTAIVQN